jgi:23S rRNA pseudouridine1911/1915/1917 synthase
MQIKHIITAAEDNVPLKNILRRTLCLSNALLKKMKMTQNVLVNGRPHRFVDRVHHGDVISVQVQFNDEESTILPQDIQLDILYEDDAIIALNKPPDMVIHPCAGHPDGTLGNALMGYFNRTGQKVKLRPMGRLDKNTTGLVLFAKNQYVQDFFIRQMKERLYAKKYLGIVHGAFFPPDGEISLPIARKEGSIIERITDPGGVESLTLYNTIRQYEAYSLVQFQIITGRTHQIRVHCAAVGKPLLGDTLYGNIPTSLISRQALHSHMASFIHPVLGERITLKAPVPEDMQKVLAQMETDNADGNNTMVVE